MSTLQEQKLENLRAVLGGLYDNSPFYRRHLGEAFQPETVQSLADLAGLPLINRQTLRGVSPFDLLASRDSRPAAYYESSGTTGEPVVGFPDLSEAKAKSFGRFLDSWMGLSNARIQLAMVALAYEMNPTGIRFQLALPHAGITVIPCGVRSTLCSPEKTVELIDRLRPGALFSRPYELLRFADSMMAMGINPSDSSLTKLFFLGEVMSRAKRKRIQELWGDADIYGHYGLTEIDTGLHTCELGHYHEPSNPFVIMELVDGPPELLELGGWREAVFTVTRNASAPLIRYKTADLMRPVKCSCSHPTPAYEILGRISDWGSFDGKTVFPVDIENVVFDMPEIGNEYQFVLRPDGSLLLRLERRHGCMSSLAELVQQVKERMGDELGIHCDVDMVSFGDLADKYGIPFTKSGRYTDLRGLDAEFHHAKLRINLVESWQLRDAAGRPITI